MQTTCPRCQTAVELGSGPAPSSIVCPACQFSFSVDAEATLDFPRPAGRSPASADSWPAVAPSIPRFQFITLLATGAQGAVWKARDTRLGRIVAVKILRYTDAGPVPREAAISARLQHPGFVTVLDAGLEGGQIYIVTEHFDGRKLNELIAERNFSPRKAAAICRQIACAMQHAHDRGVVHRDLKPTNILVGFDGIPRILDFGIAVLDGHLADQPLGVLVGTPA